MSPAAVRLGTSEAFDFFDIEGQVYRAPKGAGVDTAGLPMGKRWECSRAHWERYRVSVFAWVV